MSETKYVIQASVGGQWRTRAHPKDRAEALATGYRMLESGEYVDVRVLESYYNQDKGSQSWRQLSIPVPMEVADPPPRKPRRRKKAEDAAPPQPAPPPAPPPESPAPEPPPAEPDALTEAIEHPVAPPQVAPTEPTAAEAEFFKLLSDAPPPTPQAATDEPKRPQTLAEIRANLRAQLQKPIADEEAAPLPPPPMADDAAAPEPTLPSYMAGPPPTVLMPPIPEDEPPSRADDSPSESGFPTRLEHPESRLGLPPRELRRGIDEPRPRSSLGPIVATILGLVAAAAGAGWYFRDLLPVRFGTLGQGQHAEPKAKGLPLGVAAAAADVVAALDVGDAATVATLLPNSGGPNATDEQGVPLLLRAARQKDPAMALLLLDLGADPKAKGALRFSAFEQTVIEGLAETVVVMLRKGADPNMTDSVDACGAPLVRAIEQNHAEIVRLLIGAGASIKPRADCPTGPLDAARDRPAIRALIEETTGERSETEPVEKLLERSIARAVEDGNERTLRALLLGGIPPGVDLARVKIVANDKWGTGERGLVDHAAYTGHIGIVKELMAVGARPSTRLLHLAIANYGSELPGVARALIDGGADPNAVQDGLTPLMRAAIARNADLAKRLIDKGADPAAKDPQGRIAASFVSANDSELRRLLVK